MDERLSDVEWLVRQYENRTLSSIADELGCASDTVRARLVAAGVPIRTKPENAALLRPVELDDREWLRDQCTDASAAEVAAQLGVNPQRELAAMRRHGIPVKSSVDALRARRPLLHDPDALAAAVAETSVADVAASLGVSVIGVQVALTRNGAQSAHRYNGARRKRPSASSLQRWWASEQTLKGVARQAGVSPPTAAVCLAEVGIFLRSEPAIAALDLRRAIERQESLAAIAADHGLSTNTVLVELHRHGLFTAHRRRHLAS